MEDYHITTTFGISHTTTTEVLFCYKCLQLKVIKPINPGLETIYDPHLCGECNDLKWIDVFFKKEKP